MADFSDILKIVRMVVDPVATRVKSVVMRAVVDAVDDSKMGQEVRLSGLATEVLDEVERLGPMPGITAYPPVGSEAVVVAVGGNRDHPIVVAVEDRRYRPKGVMSEGDVIIYHPTAGTQIHVKADGSIDITAGAGVNVTGDVDVTGDLNVSGDIVGGGDVEDSTRSMAADRTIYNTHTHPENGAGGGVTSPPIQSQ